MCTSIIAWRSSNGSMYHARVFTNGYTNRYFARPGFTCSFSRLSPIRSSYCDRFVIARYENGVSSHRPMVLCLIAVSSAETSSNVLVADQIRKSQSPRIPTVEYVRSIGNRSRHSSSSSASSLRAADRSSSGWPRKVRSTL